MYFHSFSSSRAFILFIYFFAVEHLYSKCKGLGSIPSSSGGGGRWREEEEGGEKEEEERAEEEKRRRREKRRRKIIALV